MSTYLFAGTVLFYCLGAVLSLVLRRNQTTVLLLSNLVAGIGSLCGTWLGAKILITGQIYELVAGELLPGLQYHFRIDPLGGFFLFLICAIGFVVSIYSVSYEKEYLGRKCVGFLGSMYNLFLLSMVLVVSAANVFLFVVVWELMAVVSYFLVSYEHEESSVRRAGFIYIVMTHLGTLFILLAFFMLYRASGSFEYSAFKGLNLSLGQKNLIFLLAVIGFGAKAGIIPLHIWLPRAHPAAPSNVSALMSGVMVKTAIYMLLRLVLDFTGPGPVWWGWLITAIGLLSAFIGIVYAMIDKDLKRLLAYSTVENVGIIFIALGAGFTAWSLGFSGIATLALGAALFHCLNHAVFKSLLFMGAGSILQSTHTKNIERLGGLIKKMPYTAFFFLAGSVAISAFPPFNGFFSEWLAFQSLLSLGLSASGWEKVLAPVVASLLGLIGALAAATFIKAFGISFLAQPRSEQALHAKEVAKPMLLAQGIMAVAALFMGILAGPIFSTIAKVLYPGLSNQDSTMTLRNFGLPTAQNDLSLGGIAPGALFFLILLVICCSIVLAKLLGGKTKVTVGETWNCGIPLNSRMEYTGTGLVKPLRRVFGGIIRQERDIETQYRDSRYFLEKMVYHSNFKSNFEEFLYRPLNRLLLAFSQKVRAFQTGSIHMYLGYIFVTLLILLAAAR